MSLSEFIKENRVLVAGFILPLLLVGLLAFAKTIPDKTIPAPEYKVAYMTQMWSGLGQVKSDVDDQGKLSFSFKKNDNPMANAEIPKASIYVYDPASGTHEEYQLKITETEDAITVETPAELGKSTFSSKTIAPDEYLFEEYHYRNHTLITDIFISHHNENTPTLSKKGKLVRLPAPANYYYGNVAFIGWITAEQK